MVGKGPDDTVFAFPVVLLWEIVLFLGVTLPIFLFSLVKQAPLEEIANPMVTTDPAKAPWYFVGLQELLEHMHPTAGWGDHSYCFRVCFWWLFPTSTTPAPMWACGLPPVGAGASQF